MPELTWKRRTHNPEVAGSNPARATSESAGQEGCRGIGAPLRFPGLQTICKRATEIPSEQRFGHSHFPFEPVLVDAGIRIGEARGAESTRPCELAVVWRLTMHARLRRGLEPVALKPRLWRAD
jgi:hypothetical protein